MQRFFWDSEFLGRYKSSSQSDCATRLARRSDCKACETPGQLQGSKTLKPEIPRKKLKNDPPGPDPKLLEKTQKILKIQNSIFRVFLVSFEVFFQGMSGHGPGGNF